MALGQQGDWLRPEVIAEDKGSGASARAAMFELRPLSLGEVLDRTFALYKSRFWLFAGISVIAAAVRSLVQAFSLATAHTLFRTVGPFGQPTPQPRGLPTHFVAAEIRTWVAALIFFLVFSITQAATSLAMSEVYLNRPTSAKFALVVALKRWYRWVAIALWQAWSMMWICLAAAIPGMILLGFGTRSGNVALTVIGTILLVIGILGGLPAGFVLYLRNTLAVPAAIVEGLKVRAAMRRSKTLAAGTKGRIFMVLLIAAVLYWVMSILETPATFLIMMAPHQQHYLAQAITLLVSFVGNTVVGPVALIGLTLVYFDQRVRKEALDLQLLLEQARGPMGPQPMPPVELPPLEVGPAELPTAAPGRIAPVE